MKCQLFYCELMRERRCCYYCSLRPRCKNQCLNGPERCGQAVEETRGRAPTHIKAQLEK